MFHHMQCMIGRHLMIGHILAETDPASFKVLIVSANVGSYFRITSYLQCGRIGGHRNEVVALLSDLAVIIGRT